MIPQNVRKITNLGSILGFYSENDVKKMKTSPKKSRQKESIHSSSELQKNRWLTIPNIRESTRMPLVSSVILAPFAFTFSYKALLLTALHCTALQAASC